MKKHTLSLLAGLMLGIGGLSGIALAESQFPPLGPLPPVKAPTDNPTTPEKVELGRKLFFESRLGGDASSPCSACHIPEQGWGDGGEISRGYPGTTHWRNTAPIHLPPVIRQFDTKSAHRQKTSQFHAISILPV